ncbi:efflux RND transporter periplasmic adaptor subunit [Pollutibacter soli]|uniref:efflux RND transporter periplasmic adaptor subunit n=1 Tax=Pollutibacter soli TaxID=3034157 RepID=UPI00301364F7
MRTLIILIVILVSGSCKNKPQETEQKKETVTDRVSMSPEQISKAGIETGVVTKHKLKSELVVNGTVDVPPQNIVSVSFPLGGYLKSTKLIPGMHVSKGEVIAIVEDQALIQLQQDYLVTRNNLAFLETEFKRQQLLHDNQVNADKVYQKTKSEFEGQKILLRGFEEKLRLVGINPSNLTDQNISRSVAVHSPINGFVAKVNVNIGKFINATDVLFELINPADIHAALTVFEKDVSKVKPGQRVMVSFVDNPDEEYPCEVLLVSKNVDESRGTLVHCHFEVQPKQLLPGMFLKARISITDAEVVAVPEEAVVRFGSDEYVLEQEDSTTFRLIHVQSGITDSGLVEIKSTQDLTGKSIITKNAYPVMAKLKTSEE